MRVVVLVLCALLGLARGDCIAPKNVLIVAQNGIISTNETIYHGDTVTFRYPETQGVHEVVNLAPNGCGIANNSIVSCDFTSYTGCVFNTLTTQPRNVTVAVTSPDQNEPNGIDCLSFLTLNILPIPCSESTPVDPQRFRFVDGRLFGAGRQIRWSNETGLLSINLQRSKYSAVEYRASAGVAQVSVGTFDQCYISVNTHMSLVYAGKRVPVRQKLDYGPPNPGSRVALQAQYESAEPQSITLTCDTTTTHSMGCVYSTHTGQLAARPITKGNCSQLEGMAAFSIAGKTGQLLTGSGHPVCIKLGNVLVVANKKHGCASRAELLFASVLSGSDKRRVFWSIGETSLLMYDLIASPTGSLKLSPRDTPFYSGVSLTYRRNTSNWFWLGVPFDIGGSDPVQQTEISQSPAFVASDHNDCRRSVIELPAGTVPMIQWPSPKAWDPDTAFEKIPEDTLGNKCDADAHALSSGGLLFSTEECAFLGAYLTAETAPCATGFSFNAQLTPPTCDWTDYTKEECTPAPTLHNLYPAWVTQTGQNKCVVDTSFSDVECDRIHLLHSPLMAPNLSAKHCASKLCQFGGIESIEHRFIYSKTGATFNVDTSSFSFEACCSSK